MSLPKYKHVSHTAMNGYYTEVIRQIANTGMVPDVIVALSRGGLDFGVKLSHYYNDAELMPLRWQTRDGSVTDAGQLHAILKEHTGRNLLIVDDILDSGETLEQIQEVADGYCSSVDIYYAVAIENTESGIEVDFSGSEIQRSEQPEWIVFPWEDWWK